VRRKILALVALAFMVVPVAPAAAVYHAGGWHAEASWTTEPESGPVAGVIYAGAYLYASNELGFIGRGPADPRPVLSLYKFVYTYVEVEGQLQQVLISDWGASAIGNAVRLRIDGTLASASTSGIVTATACTYDATGNAACQSAGTASLAATWTGQGDISRLRDFTHEVTPTYTFFFSGWTTSRNASVSATVDGAQVGAGQRLQYADIFHSTSAANFACHGPSTCF
jgi:hypothetical protein